MRSLPRALTIALPSLCIVVACTGTSEPQLSGPDVVRCGISMTGPQQLPSNSSQATFAIDAPRECSWTAAANVSWIQLSPASGQGAATLVAAAADNPQSQARTAVVTVNDRTWSIVQAGAPAPVPPPDSTTDETPAPPALPDPAPDFPVFVPVDPTPTQPTQEPAPPTTEPPSTGAQPSPPTGSSGPSIEDDEDDDKGKDKAEKPDKENDNRGPGNNSGN